MTEKLLVSELEKWFNLHSADKNRWCLNSVGILLKNKLKNLGNWKNAPRGNPAKGRRIAIENKMKKNAIGKN